MGFQARLVMATVLVAQASAFTPPRHGLSAARDVVAQRPSSRPHVTMGMIGDVIERLFGRNGAARSVAASRLNVMLASDRVALDQATLIKIRQGIIELVQQYVEIQADDVILDIQNEERKSILTASLAIKGPRASDGSKPVAVISVSSEAPPEAALETPTPGASPSRGTSTTGP